MGDWDTHALPFEITSFFNLIDVLTKIVKQPQNALASLETAKLK